jgi:hypothetical protein
MEFFRTQSHINILFKTFDYKELFAVKRSMYSFGKKKKRKKTRKNTPK